MKDGNGITRREHMMAELVMEGLSNKHIAHKLKISPHTVREALHKIFGKLDIRNRAQLAVWASSRIGMYDHDCYDR